MDSEVSRVFSNQQFDTKLKLFKSEEMNSGHLIQWTLIVEYLETVEKIALRFFLTEIPCDSGIFMIPFILIEWTIFSKKANYQHYLIKDIKEHKPIFSQSL